MLSVGQSEFVIADDGSSQAWMLATSNKANSNTAYEWAKADLAIRPNSNKVHLR